MTSSDLLNLSFPRALHWSTVGALLGLLLVWSFGLRLWFATPDPSPTRFYDERYGLENLEPLLKEGQLRPVHGFHPGLSYLPHGLLLKASDLLYRATGWESLAIFDARGRYTETAYLICRGLSVTFGTLSLLLLFLIGRRLGGERLGLLAAFILAVVPWHIRQSVLFKADITLLLTVVLTVYLSLRAIDRPSVRSFAAAGVAIGLALSSKFNAGPVAIPLTLGAFLTKGSRRRAFLLLVLAAGVSIAVFLLLQPYVLIEPDIYRRSMSRTSRIYESFAQREGRGRLYLFWHLFESLLSSSFHGPVVGGLAVVGLGTVAVLASRHRRTSNVALPWLMVLSFVVGYTMLYALATRRPSAHNWLPVSPFAALGAAWLVLAAWLWISERLPAWAGRPVGASCATLLVVLAGWQASAYVYRETVPRTGDRVLEILRGQLSRPAGRLVVSEHDFQIHFAIRHRAGRLAIQGVSSLAELGHEALDRVDAEVFAADLLADPQRGEFYRQRLESWQRQSLTIVEPGLFRTWGPPLAILIHPLKNKAQWEGVLVRSDDDPELYVAEIGPELVDRGLLSIELWVSPKMDIRGVEIDGPRVEAIAFRGPRRQIPMTTTRFDYRPRIFLEISGARDRDHFPMTIRNWRKRRKSVSRP